VPTSKHISFRTYNGAIVPIKQYIDFPAKHANETLSKVFTTKEVSNFIASEMLMLCLVIVSLRLAHYLARYAIRMWLRFLKIR
jgi:hypothetical protein